MSFFTAAELAELRTIQESAFEDSCTIAVPTETADGHSGFTHTWTAGAAIACGVSSPSQAANAGISVMDYGADVHQMVFSLPYTTAVKQGYRITWKSRTFEVERVEQPGTYPMQITAIGLERT